MMLGVWSSLCIVSAGDGISYATRLLLFSQLHHGSGIGALPWTYPPLSTYANAHPIEHGFFYDT